MKNIYYQVYENSGNSALAETKNLVLIHGFMGSTLDWDSLVNFLLSRSQNSLKIISILLPGHTQKVSNSLENNFSKDEFSKIYNPINSSNNCLPKVAKQIIEIQKKEDVLNCTYLGYSMGARVAIELASLNNNTQSLVLESGFTHWENKKEQHQKKEEDFNLLKNLLNLTSDLGQEDLLKKNFKQFLLDWYNLSLFKGINQNKDFSFLIEKRLQQNVGDLHKALQAYSSSSINSYLDILKKLNCPAFYIYGEKDKKYKNIALTLKDTVSQINLQKIKNASHNTHFQQSLNFNKLILDLLN